MSEKIGFAIAIFLLSQGFATAKSDFKTCSKAGLVLLHVNGVLTDRETALVTAEKLQKYFFK